MLASGHGAFPVIDDLDDGAVPEQVLVPVPAVARDGRVVGCTVRALNPDRSGVPYERAHLGGQYLGAGCDVPKWNREPPRELSCCKLAKH